jgi:hypothetical protein
MRKDFRVVRGNGRRDVLQHHGFTGARRGDDEGALAFADRRDQVDHPRGIVLGHALHGGLGDLHLHFQAGGRVKRGQVVEIDAMLDGFRRLEIDLIDLDQR